jgi:hypothetical protein
MSVVTLVKTSLSPRVAAVARLQTTRPARRVGRHRPVHVDGRRPARLVAAPFRQSVADCVPQPVVRTVGWLVLVGLLTFVVVLGIAWAGGGAAASVPARTVSVTVRPGETLWSVARRMAPGVPATDEVTKIRQLNGLDVDTVLYPGELLTVPTSH